jgi:periplasmic divalent cation tolerance protein
MTDVVIVLTTVADSADAETLARQLVEERLAACVNVLPAMVSFYRWKGTVERGAERQMVIKTTQDSLAALQGRLAQLHGYELPEFLVIRDVDSSAEYFSWVNDAVGDPNP